MSVRFHLSASGIFARSRSCALTATDDAISTPSALAMNRRALEKALIVMALFYDGPPGLFSSGMRWISRGDIDGFFGLALDNLVQLLLIDTLCRFVLGFPVDLVYGRVLPGAAVSILIGNIFYSWQAKKLAERTGRTD